MMFIEVYTCFCNEAKIGYIFLHWHVLLCHCDITETIELKYC